MDQQERDLISQFVSRVGGTPSSGPGGPQNALNLPPIDPEADQWIAANFEKYPEARYRVTQMAVVQEVALAQAQNRIRQLEFQLQQAQAQVQQRQQRPQGGGIFGGLFGAHRGAAPPPPGWGGQPQQGYPPAQQASYPPGYTAGMFQQRCPGFLGSALTTATGVAGGMLAANAIESLFSGHHGMGGAGFGGDDAASTGGFGDANLGDPFDGSGQDAGDSYDAGDWGGDDGGWGDDSF